MKFYDLSLKKSVNVNDKDVKYVTKTINGKNGKRVITFARHGSLSRIVSNTKSGSKCPKKLRSKSPKKLGSKSPKKLRSKSPKKLGSKSPKKLGSKSPKKLGSKSPKKLRFKCSC